MRFEIDEPSPTGRAAHVRALVSSTQPPRASAIRNDEKYGVVLDGARRSRPDRARRARGGHDRERVVGGARLLEPEPDEIHPQQPDGLRARIVDRPDALVADRDAVLVDAVLDAPQPRGVRPDQRGRARIGNAEVLRVERVARGPRAVRDEHLRLAGRAVGILREHHARAGAQAERVAGSDPAYAVAASCAQRNQMRW